MKLLLLSLHARSHLDPLVQVLLRGLHRTLILLVHAVGWGVVLANRFDQAVLYLSVAALAPRLVDLLVGEQNAGLDGSIGAAHASTYVDSLLGLAHLVVYASASRLRGHVGVDGLDHHGLLVECGLLHEHDWLVADLLLVGLTATNCGSRPVVRVACSHGRWEVKGEGVGLKSID